MRAVIQRVSRAQCVVEGQVTGAIERGLLVFLGVAADDTDDDQAWLARKIPRIRVFEDDAGKMNRSVRDIGGGILLISQFTLFGNLQKGTRPSFNHAAPPPLAVPRYEAFHRQLETELGQPVGTGVFGAHMDIDAANDGPVTLVIDTRQRDW